MIKIGKPYVKEMPNSTRLCASVNYDGSDHEIWYGVEKKYAEFLCWERADAFLLAFLPYAMAFEHDIVIDAPVSERLYYQLVNYYIPCLAKFTHYYSAIQIDCTELDSTNFGINASGVATGFSAGVDSFYSVLKHLDNEEEEYKLTHLTFFKVGATGSFGGEKAERVFKHRVNQFKEYATLHNLEFVIVDSNISEHARMSYNYIHTFRSMSAVLALQKLFRVYYYASTGTIGDFCFNVVDVANFDFFNLNNFTVEGMQLYSVGLDCERLEKQEYIQEFEDTYKYLNVCNKEADNCSRCEKCIRTMAGFHCLGTLERYKDVFDIEYYKHNFAKCMGLLIGKKFDGTAEGNIDAALVKTMKARGIAIPPAAYIKAIPVAIRSVAFRTARSIRPIRKWYHKRMNKKLGCNYKD